MGVVGSTQNILDFIAAKLTDSISEQQATSHNTAGASAVPAALRLRFVLGTEAGMITSIVRKVQQLLRKASMVC